MRQCGRMRWRFAMGVAACLACALLYLQNCAVAAQSAENGARRERAVLIGMDYFVSKADTYPSSTNNVYAMQETFQRAEHPLEVLLIPEEPITSVEALTEVIQQAFQYAQEDDVSYLYISTHGVYEPHTGQEPALLLSDGTEEGRITPEQLEAAFDGIKGTKVLLLDACNSGAFIGKGLAMQPDKVCFLADDFKVITSSGALEESWYWSAADLDVEGEALQEGHSMPQGAFYFTQALSQGLSARYNYPADANRDGIVTLYELYEYLLQNHAASTPQVYPQQDDFVVFTYDKRVTTLQSIRRSPILDVTFSGTMLERKHSSITLEFIATRPVRVAYQIVYQKDGKWMFDEAQLLYDEAERFTAFGDQLGAVSAGRKVRTLSISLDAVDVYGYVMVQLVSIDQGRLTVHAGRVLCVPPAEGDLQLSVDTKPAYVRQEMKELSIFVEHSYPCALSVAVVDEGGAVVRRLCHRRSTRPAQTDPAGSLFYWDGTDKNGEALPPGTYRVEVSGMMNELTFTAQSGEIVLR